jgi:hypothetical protein
MTKALKVMTFNTQQLPWLARKISGLPIAGTPGGSPEPDPVGRAHAVARAILDMPVREQPDIVAFNEAFSEIARPILISMLRAKFPHIIEKLEHSGLDVEEDSGLMLFSKLPFLPLPGGGDHIYKPFPMAKGHDAKVAKGVGIVQINGPAEPTTIAFTHTQASYDKANTEYADVRVKQIDFIRQMLMELANGNMQNYANSVIMGDLNIKGDPDETSGEDNFIFSKKPDTFGGDFNDGWRISMHPPGDMTDYDPGYTQRDTPTNQRNRFDYICTQRDANVDIGLLPHYMAVPLRLPSEVSDHWALLAHLHRQSPHCAPAQAIDLLSVTPINNNQSESTVWLQTTNFRDEDMYHWIYVARPGTVSIFTGADIEAHAFRQTDFTHALQPTDMLSIAELPENLQNVIGEYGRQLVEKGAVFSWKEPFFIRLRGVTTNFLGSAPFMILEHQGDSPATAIILHPHLELNPKLPPGQPLGLTDQCFFKVKRENKFTGALYEDRFLLCNDNHVGVTFEIWDAAQKPLMPPVSGTSAELRLNRTASAELLYLILHRSNVNDVNFSVLWDSPLTFVRFDESFRLHIDDETGADWPGDDEYDLTVDIDSDNVFSDSWDNADTGEDWPSLANTIRGSVQARQGQGDWAAFTGEITFSALKTDGISAHGSVGGFIRALDETDYDNVLRIASITIPDTLSDGHLTAYASLTKFPPV